jgi:hypothetical protein
LGEDMRKGDRFIYVRTNEEIQFLKRKGLEYTFKYVDKITTKPYICIIGSNPLLSGKIIPKP